MSWFSQSTLGMAQNNVFSRVTAYGTSNVSLEPSSRFLDPFDGTTIDVTNRWTTSGTNAPTQANGSLVLSLPATASLSSVITSQPTFGESLGFGILGTTLLLETAPPGVTNSHRFFGFGQVTSYAYATPLTDGMGFEVDGTGAFNVVVYVAGNRFVINSSNSNLITPQATLNALGAGSTVYGKALPFPVGFNRFVIYMRPDIAFFYINDLDVPVAGVSFLQPQASTLPVRLAAITNTAGTIAAATFQSGAIGVGDSASMNSTISDGVYPWRTLQVGARGDVQTSLMDGNKASYSASVTGAAGVVGDTLTLTGSATKTIRVTRLSLTGIATAATDLDIQVIKRSTADTAGTSSGVTACPHDSANSAASATALLYTVAPTPGTPVGTPIRAAKVFAATAATAPVIQSWDFGNGPKQGIVLRGIAQVIAVNFSAALTGGSFDIDIEWTEE